MNLHFFVNDESIFLENIQPNRRLIDLLRDELQLKGTKEGCSEGECGACTVLIDGKAVNSCLVLACQLEDCHVLTIEGLAKDGELDALQKAFINANAIQCGYCTPGMILAAKGLLLENPHPSGTEIRNALAGNICRCSGYSQIVSAVMHASAGNAADGEPGGENGC